MEASAVRPIRWKSCRAYSYLVLRTRPHFVPLSAYSAENDLSCIVVGKYGVFIQYSFESRDGKYLPAGNWLYLLYFCFCRP